MKLLALAILTWSSVASAATAKRVVVSWQFPGLRGRAGSVTTTRGAEGHTDGTRAVPVALVQGLVDAVTGPRVARLDARSLVETGALGVDFSRYLSGAETMDTDWLDEARTPLRLAERVSRHDDAPCVQGDDDESWLKIETVIAP